MQVDVQRVLKVSRLQNTDGEKMKKSSTVHMMNGMSALSFLRTKELFFASGTAKSIWSRFSLSKVTSPLLTHKKYQSPFEQFNESLDSETSFYSFQRSLSNDNSASPLDTTFNKKSRAQLLSSLLFEHEKAPSSGMRLNYPIDRNEIDTLKILLSDSPVTGI
jgi:hypothetical protein